MAPQWEAASREIRRVGDESSIVGAYGWFGLFNLWGETEFDPVFEALVEHDLPLILHGSLSFWAPTDARRRPDADLDGYPRPRLGRPRPSHHGQPHPASSTPSPELNVVLEEGGRWWLSFVRYRLDEFYEMHPEESGSSRASTARARSISTSGPAIASGKTCM